MKRDERILVILNPASGVVSKDVATAVIFKKLRKHFDTVSIISSSSRERGFEIARNALDHFDVITAFGGDGTINSIASAMIGTDKVLGIIPGGSGNGLVRNLGIPLSWRRALDVLIHGQDVHIDAGQINEHYFFNVAGIGLDGLISKKYNLETKARGMAPYIDYGVKGFLEMPSFRIQINLGDVEFQDEILIGAFANFKQYGGNAIIAPFASPYDGLLDMCIINKFKLLKASLNIQKLFTGNIHKLPFYKSFKIDHVLIKSLDRELPCTIDGEYGGEDLLEYDIRVLPAKIKIRIPYSNL
jgi:diacylglycerol kinase (ATP)